MLGFGLRCGFLILAVLRFGFWGLVQVGFSASLAAFGLLVAGLWCFSLFRWFEGCMV